MGHIVHISGVYQQLFLILEDGEPARLHFAALVHCTLNPHIPGHVGVGVACDGLTEVGLKEGQQGDLSALPRSQVATCRPV